MKKIKTNENDNKHKTQLKPNKQKQGHNAFGPYQVNSNKKTVIVTAPTTYTIIGDVANVFSVHCVYYTIT